MKRIFVLGAFAMSAALPYFALAQIPSGLPPGTTYQLYNPGSGGNILSTTVATDPREIGFNGVIYAFSNTAWPKCVSWGLPKGGINLVNGSAEGGCGTTPTYSTVAFSNITSTNIATFTGQTQYTYTAAGVMFTDNSVPIRLRITVVDNAGAAIPIQTTANFIYVPIGQGNSTFRVMVQIQAQGPSSSSAPFALYTTSGQGVDPGNATSSYTCADHSGQWVGAIQLFNCLHTVQGDQICSTYPGTPGGNQFLIGTSTCGLTTTPTLVNAESVAGCQDGSIQFTVQQGSCSSWTAQLWNNNYSTLITSWPSGSGATVSWTNRPPGAYHVVINDNNGLCAQRLDVTINEGVPCHVKFNNPDSLHTSPTSVAGCDDGSINVSYDARVCGNTWNAILYDDLSNIIATFNATVPNNTAVLWNNLPSGNYQIIVTSNSVCDHDTTITVVDGPPCRVEVQNVQQSVTNCDDNIIYADISSLTCDDKWYAYLYVSDYSSYIRQRDYTQSPDITWTDIPLGDYHIIATDNVNCTDTVHVTLTCSDNDPCTNDLCSPTCTHPYKCEDNNPCTEDFCQTGGICQNQPIVCNDGDACTNDACVGGNCQFTPVNCADNNPCTVDQCFSGNCAHTPMVCNDGNACTNDFCQAGNCVFQPLCTLNDNNPCTDDFCVNRTCLHVQKNCDDGISCTTDFCSGGQCFNAPTCVLDDNDECTADQCQNGVCLHIPTNCNDNFSCTRDYCQGGDCFNEAICELDDSNACTVDTCVNGQCLHTPINCSDDDPCTADVCTGGVCSNPPLCPDDNDACTNDSCSNGLCLYPLISCNDFGSCTIDFCENGSCQHVPLCALDDGNPCTIDICIAGQCQHQPVNCDDGNACTIDTCDNNNNCVFNPLCPADGNPCTTDLCVSGTCLNIPTDCDDGDLCTVDSCDLSGNCAYAPSCVVDDGISCTADTCNHGVCLHQNICTCAVHSDCNDNNACTLDSCLAGSCDYSASIACNDLSSCTDDYCLNGFCEHDPIYCNDLDACTMDTCIGGSCRNTPLNCADASLCTNDTCIGGFCINAPVACDDNISCTTDACNPGNGNCVFTPVVCPSDGLPCTTDTCVSGSCVSLPKNCDDDNLCTTDACASGICQHNPMVCPGDGDPCTADFCLSGVCTSQPLVCDDQNLCTTDYCDSILAACAYDPVCDNDDSDPCTNDTCINGQCLNIQIACNDNNSCTNDFCDNGVCTYDPTCDLDDGNPCTDDTCINSACVYIPKDCDDNISCTIDSCNAGTCLNTYTCQLDDGDPCTVDTCGIGDCIHFPKTCNDFSSCTDDFCQNGICVFDPLCVLDDGDLCTNDFCISGQCIHQGIFCNDGNLCTDDECQGGVCVYDPIACDDGNSCTTDSCLNGNCIFVPIVGPCNNACDTMVCDDGNACTTNSCANGVCFYDPMNCNDNDQCTTDGCTGGICTHAPILNCNVTISGTVVTEVDAGVRSVTVKMTGSGNQTVVTGTDGKFTFTAYQGDSITIIPSKANDTVINNGISTLDLILIQRQILALQPLASHYKKIAADVNNSQTISTLDIILIRAVILAIAQSFPNGRLWAFVPSDHVFPDPQSPFPYPNHRTYPNITSDKTGQDFIGMKLGDVNNSYNPNIAKTETVGDVRFMMSEYNVLRGEEITVPVRVKDFKKITGCQFTLSWDPEVLQLLETKDKSLKGHFGMSAVESGKLTTSWFDEMTREVTLPDGDAAFELKFRVVGEAGSQSAIAIGSELTQAEAYNDRLDMLGIISESGMVKVDGFTPIINSQSSIKLSVVPNPFGNVTNINFTLQRDQEASIMIYDLLGKEIKHIIGSFKAGSYSIEWAGDDDAGKSLSRGLYQVRLVAGDDAIGEKVLLIR